MRKAAELPSEARVVVVDEAQLEPLERVALLLEQSLRERRAVAELRQAGLERPLDIRDEIPEGFVPGADDRLAQRLELVALAPRQRDELGHRSAVTPGPIRLLAPEARDRR